MRLKFRRLSIANIPLLLVFVVFPIISAVSRFFGLPKVNYEVFNLILLPFLFLCGIVRRRFFNKSLGWVIILLSIFVCFKYLLPIYYVDRIVWRAFFIDLKWIIYFYCALIWIGIFGNVDFERFYELGKKYVYIYITYVLLMALKTGYFTRSNAGLLSECNYDCFLILLPFCFYFDKVRPFSELLLFAFAVLLSTSKTGFMTFSAILFFQRVKKSHLKFLYFIGLSGIIVLWVKIYFINRGVDNIDDVDRAIYFIQFFQYLSQASIDNLLFGYFPGRPMDIDPMYSFEWTIQKFEDINHISGCYPFIFHSTYMRLGIVWGIPLVIFLFGIVLRISYKSHVDSFKYLLIVFLLESVSLSSLSLENISFVFFVIIISSLLNNRRKRPQMMFCPKI